MCVFGQAIEKDKKLRELREQARCEANPIGTNDFDYEDKQKTQDSIQVYEGLHFNLAAENSKPFFSYHQSSQCRHLYNLMAIYYTMISCYASERISAKYCLSV